MPRRAHPYPHVHRMEDRQGRERYLLRIPGRKAVTLKGRYGSEEFAESYRNAVAGTAPPKGIPTKPGTVAAAARRYLNSAAFAAGLAPTTQRVRRHQIEQFAVEHGDKHIVTLEPRHVKAMIAALATKPGRARGLITVIRALVRQAIDDGILTHDPTVAIERPRLRKGGWRTWSEDHIAQYEARHPVGSQARLAIGLALYTGQRRSDLVRMGRQHIRNGTISVLQQKTGTSLAIPIHPDLQVILDAVPS